MSLLEAIASRRSVGRVLPEPLPREAVEELLAAAVAAPNHHLTAPWRFVVLAGAARREVGEAHARAVARAKPDLPAQALAKEAARLERAPVVAAAIVLGSDDPVQGREDRDAVAAAIQDPLLAHGAGLGDVAHRGDGRRARGARGALGLAPGLTPWSGSSTWAACWAAALTAPAAARGEVAVRRGGEAGVAGSLARREAWGWPRPSQTRSSGRVEALTTEGSVPSRAAAFWARRRRDGPLGVGDLLGLRRRRPQGRARPGARPGWPPPSRSRGALRRLLSRRDSAALTPGDGAALVEAGATVEQAARRFGGDEEQAEEIVRASTRWLARQGAPPRRRRTTAAGRRPSRPRCATCAASWSAPSAPSPGARRAGRRLGRRPRLLEPRDGHAALGPRSDG